MNEAPNSPGNSIPEPQTPTESTSENTPQQVTNLLTLRLNPDTHDTSSWPKHMVIEDLPASGMVWGLLDSMRETGHIADGGATKVWSSREVS